MAPYKPEYSADTIPSWVACPAPWQSQPTLDPMGKQRPSLDGLTIPPQHCPPLAQVTMKPCTTFVPLPRRVPGSLKMASISAPHAPVTSLPATLDDSPWSTPTERLTRSGTVDSATSDEKSSSSASQTSWTNAGACEHHAQSAAQLAATLHSLGIPLEEGEDL